MDALVRNAWLVPFLPLLGALIAAVGGRWLKERSSIPVVAGIGLAFLVSLGLLFSVGKTEAEPDSIEWLTIGPKYDAFGHHLQTDENGDLVKIDKAGKPIGADSKPIQVDRDGHYINAQGLRIDSNWSLAYELNIPIRFQVDGLTTMMLAMVTFVAMLVAIYSTGYMANDPAYPRFFAMVGLFVFSMTGLVLSSNFLLTYVFWEGVGVCSYLLVGFWHTKPEAALAAKKAFMVNRIGDVGFAIAIFWMWVVSPGHSLDYETILDPTNLKLLPAAAIVGIPLLLFWAATAKSAQVPLYVWLPDAMEGPTPVSALIHAATMVTAGVYLVARSTPLFIQSPGVQLTVSIVGCATALLAAAIAVTQTDLKRVMAYSTVSQLGYMFMALGAGVKGVGEFAIIAGMFHLFTHAFFKALLFLSSGSVMHAMGGVIDMREFGGLRKRLPVTHLTFAFGALALCGIPVFAGFFSKDEILTSLKRAAAVSNDSGGSGWGWVYYAIYGVAILTAFMTAFYTGRAYFMTFWGPEKLPHVSTDDSHGHGHDSHFGHESPPVMTYPLIILAVCALLVGLVFGPTGLFEHHLAQTVQLEDPQGLKAVVSGHVEAVKHSPDWATMIVGSLAAVLGLALSYALYFKPSPWPVRLATRLRPVYQASLHKFYVDEFYTRVIVWPTRYLGVTAEFFDKFLVSNLVQFVAWIPRFVGRYLLGPRQNGLVQYYAAVTALGLGMLLMFLFFAVVD